MILILTKLDSEFPLPSDPNSNAPTWESAHIVGDFLRS